MEFSGTIGVKQVVAFLYPDRVEIQHKTKVLHNITELWMIGLQRVNKQLKTCDVVWLDGSTQTPIVQSIAQTEVERVITHACCEVILLGMDPPQWSKLSTTATKNNWHKEDWLHVFSDGVTEDEEDDEWKPSDEDTDEDDLDY
mgnify:CR=1 FL=1|jgi:hypothetical protein|tara:strand:- start:5142 stop:5570 length:429 start_codon:yes stop_codon:yes gene_type:complete